MKTYGTLTYVDDRSLIPRPGWSIRATPDVTMRLKRVLPRADKSRKGALSVYDTPEVCRDLEWVMDRWPLKMSPEDAERLKRGADTHRHQADAVLRVLEGRLEPVEGLMEPAITPREYQRVAADLALTTGSLLLGDDLGLGKTFTSLLTLRDPERLPALLVVPANLTRQWLEALGEILPMLRGHILRKGTPYDLTRVRALKGHEPDVLISTYAKLAGWSNHLAGKVRTVIFDEAHELRRRESNKYKAAGQIADQATLRMGLTATPVFNFGGEMHNIFDVIAPGRLGGRAEFTREWGTQLAGGHVKITDPAALGMYLRDQGLFLRRTRADVGRELPPVVRVPHAVDTDEAVYEQLATGALDLAELVAHGSSQQKFQHSGELDAKLRHATGVAKAPYVAAFVRMLLETEEKVVLFGWHHDVYDIWREQLSDARPVFYTGSQSASQKHEAKTSFVHGNSRVLVMSLRSGAGLEGLQEVAKVCVFGELDWSPAMHDQCLDAETEVLTDRGFVGPDDLLDDDLVAGFDRETAEVRWRPIIRRVDRPLADGEGMHSIATPSVDLRVTGGHRMVYSRPYGKDRVRVGWEVDTADVLADRSQGYHIPVAGFQPAPGVPLTDDEVAFLGWWLADGTMNRRTREVAILQAKASPYNDRIREILDGCGFAWSINERKPAATAFKRRSPMLVYRIPKVKSHTRPGRGWEALAPYLDKHLSHLLEDMDRHQFGVFLEAMHQGDGAKQRGQDWTQRTYHIGISSRVLADRLQSLCVRRGWRANLAEIRTATGRPHWTLHARPVAERAIGGHGKANLAPCAPEPGERVWCVENDLGTIIVRRRGKTAVVGNCIGRLNREGAIGEVVAYFLTSPIGADPVMAEVLDLKRQQAEPIRDPNAAGLEQVVDTSDRVQRLAKDLLAKRGRMPLTIDPLEAAHAGV